MRDLLIKNLTSIEKKRRIIASSEVFEEEGFLNIIHRHFICLIKEITKIPASKPMTYMYVLRQRNTQEQKEKFFFRVKSSIYVTYHDKLFLVLFMQSLRIDLFPVPQISH